ncbi:MAG: MFS transporter [Actinomycetota bacterium]|nr:MFS transporter [Actinomycetota bacterium]
MNRSPRSNIRRLAIGRLISVTGGAAAYTALMYTVWNRTHSATWQSGTLLLTFGVVGIVGPVTGQLGDRFDRRAVMILGEAVAAVFFFAMAFVDRPAALVALAFASAIAESSFWSASVAAIPALAESEADIARANSLVAVGRNAGIMLGPVIGGLLVTWLGASWVFALNGITFLVSVALTISVRGSYREATTSDDEQEEHRGMAAGVRFVWKEHVLRRITLAWLVFLLGAGMGMVADAPLAEAFHARAFGFGLLITFWGGGSVLGSLLGRKLTSRTEPLWLVLGAAGIVFGHLGVGLAPLFTIVLASSLLMGTGDGLTMVAEQGIMQRRTPDAVRSRVLAAYDAVMSLGLVVAYIFAGPVLNALGAQHVYLVGGLAAAAATLMLLPVLRVRHDVRRPQTAIDVEPVVQG